MDWQLIQREIQNCRICEAKSVPHLFVPSEEKRKPTWEPARPTRLYFVSVAPPWGGAYFWDESKRDAVRVGLFSALGTSLNEEVRNCGQFRDMRFFLTPTVKCPSTLSNRDRHPSHLAVRHCEKFLHGELLAADSERILALGRVPFKSLCEIFGIIDAPQEVAECRKRTWWVRLGSRKVPLSGTYFPGNNRNNQRSLVEQDIDRILKLSPKDEYV